MAHDAGGRTVAFVIPAKDEAGAVGQVVARALTCGCAREVVVVDDGSTDDTAAEAEAAGAKVVRLPENRGKGRALKAGVEATDAEIVVFLDADGQDDPAETPRLLAEIERGADLVIGSRFLGTLHPGSITPVNRVANLGLTLAMSALYGRRITDSQAGFRAMRRDAYLSLPLSASRYDVETEVLARALRRGLKVVEVPVSRAPRAAGVTKMNRLTTGARIVAAMVLCRVT
jgi:glycosyltransferase involved in cell wall biosynthesis